MYVPGMATLKLVIEASDAERELLAKGGDPLRDLCRKEVDAFDEYLRNYGGDYGQGLARFERFAVEGFLYQKIRGHLDEESSSNHLPERGQDGAPQST